MSKEFLNVLHSISALHLLSEMMESFDINIDIRMPKLNGIQLDREIIKIDHEVKVCFITAYETFYEQLKKDFPRLNISCFIKKTIEPDDLMGRIIEELESYNI